MALININTTPGERNAVFEAVKKLKGKTVAVSAIAKEAGISQSRTRYALADLLDSGKVTREVTKMFNNRYIRYKYDVVE